MLRLAGKVRKRRIKTAPACPCFTLCLPGSPKVNAGGACGAWLPGRELLRISAFCDRILGNSWLLLPWGQHPARHDRDVICAELASFCEQHVTSLCNGWWRTSHPISEIAEASS